MMLLIFVVFVNSFAPFRGSLMFYIICWSETFAHSGNFTLTLERQMNLDENKIKFYVPE